VSYGVSADEARRFGLPCGGTLQLVLEPLHDAAALDALLEPLARGELLTRRLDLERPATVGAGHADQALHFDGHTLISVFGPRHRLLIIGAGQLSASLARIAMTLDFAVTVCDPREEYSEEWSVPAPR
jgi:xanthine dehydrogenase accessory factor